MVAYPRFTLAAIQAAPVLFDREASTRKACRLIEEAGEAGATLASFGECWLPGYPFFVFNRPSALMWQAAAAYIANSVCIPGPETEQLCAAARRGGVDVVIGVAERDKHSGGTVYCTLLFIGREGHILGRHRKLKPTYAERVAWGEGDGSGLRTYQRPYANLSGLNCWEHQMLLPGYALIAQGTQVHCAVWPGREPDPVPPSPVPMWPRQVLLSRAFASQAAAYVVAAAGVMRRSDVPEPFGELLALEQAGDSCIIDPRGEIIAGPLRTGEEGILLGPDCSLEAVMTAKAVCDSAGHYGRPDVFRLLVEGRELYPNRPCRDAPLEQPAGPQLGGDLVQAS